VLSVAHGIPERDDPDVDTYRGPSRTDGGEITEDGVKTWRYFVEVDLIFARALVSLSSVRTLTLTIPTHHLDAEGLPFWSFSELRPG